MSRKGKKKNIEKKTHGKKNWKKRKVKRKKKKIQKQKRCMLWKENRSMGENEGKMGQQDDICP